MSTAECRELIVLIDEAIAAGARQFRACEVIGLDERRLRRWRLSDGDRRTIGYRAIEQALSETEKDLIVEVMGAEDLCGLPPKQAYFRLMDRGAYLCSYARFLRVLKERKLVKSKRKQTLRTSGGDGEPWASAHEQRQRLCRKPVCHIQGPSDVPALPALDGSPGRPYLRRRDHLVVEN